jgi:hypothetical protein
LRAAIVPPSGAPYAARVPSLRKLKPAGAASNGAYLHPDPGKAISHRAGCSTSRTPHEAPLDEQDGDRNIVKIA